MAGAHVIRPKPWSVLKEEPLVLIGNQWPCLATHSHWASVGGRRSNLDSDARVEESSFPWIRLAGKRTGVGYGGGGLPRNLGSPRSSAPHTNHFPGERPKGRSYFLPHVIPGVVGGKAGPRACLKAWSVSLRICAATWRKFRDARGARAGLFQHVPPWLSEPSLHSSFLRVASTVCPSDLSGLIPFAPLRALATNHPVLFTIPPNAPGSFLPFCQKRAFSQVRI